MKEMRAVLHEILGSDHSPGEALKGARIKADLSQDELAEITGVRRSNISAIENERIELTLKYSLIFGVALNIHPADLLFPNGKIQKSSEVKEVERRAKAFYKKNA